MIAVFEHICEPNAGGGEECQPDGETAGMRIVFVNGDQVLASFRYQLQMLKKFVVEVLKSLSYVQQLDLLAVASPGDFGWQVNFDSDLSAILR